MAQRLRNGPVAHALLPGRQHDLSCKERVDAVAGLHLGREQSVWRGRNLDDLAAIAHRHVHDAPEPEQIFRPELARDQVELSPILLAEARLVPGLIGQARNIEIRPGEMLRAAQRVHAGIGEPRPLLSLLGFVEHEDVADLRAQQPERRREPRLPGADDQHVQRRPVVRPELWRQPRGIRMRGLGEIGANLRFESGKGVVHATSQPPSTGITVPVVKEDASLARCSAVSATSSACAKPLHGVAVARSFAHRFGIGVTGKTAPQHRGIDGARRNRIDADAIGGEIERHRPGQADDRALGGDIGRVAAAAGDRKLRRQRDDRAAALPLHLRHRRARPQPGAADIGAEHRVPIGGIGGQHRPAAGKAGRRHQHVEPARAAP